MDDAHYAGSADAGCHLIAAEVLEFRSDKRSSSVNVELEFRMSMKVTSPFNYLAVLSITGAQPPSSLWYCAKRRLSNCLSVAIIKIGMEIPCSR